MKYVMLNKDAIEQRKFAERRGMINVYICGVCKKVVTYLYADSGTTPEDILCESCGGRMFSQFESVKQPTIVWYRPRTLKDIEAIADAVFEHCGGDRQEILNNFIEWYNSGGLFAIKACVED